MGRDAFEELLDKLNEGEEHEIEATLHRIGPFVKLIVRRNLSIQMRKCVDSNDIMQSVWVELIRGIRRSRWSFADATHLRAFLTKVVHDRTIDRCRRFNARGGRESLLGELEWGEMADTVSPDPSDEAIAAELWDRMLALCPPSRRDLIRLRREGLNMQEIALRLGLNESLVQRTLADVARRLAVRNG